MNQTAWVGAGRASESRTMESLHRRKRSLSPPEPSLGEKRAVRGYGRHSCRNPLGQEAMQHRVTCELRTDLAITWATWVSPLVREWRIGSWTKISMVGQHCSSVGKNNTLTCPKSTDTTIPIRHSGKGFTLQTFLVLAWTVIQTNSCLPPEKKHALPG